MADINCPSCTGSELARWGKGAAGRQKWRCVRCGRQFVEGSDHLIDKDKKATALSLLAAGIQPKKISTALGISVRWLHELKRRMTDAS